MNWSDSNMVGSVSIKKNQCCLLKFAFDKMTNNKKNGIEIYL